jgi:cytochrome c oxidase subunit II
MYRYILFALLLLLAAACSTSSADTGAPLSPGDAARGAALFNESIGGAPVCLTCHTLDGSTLVGPSLLGFAEIAATRVEGQSAEDYARASILQPASHIVSGFSNLMYNQYAQRLTTQQTADLIAYLLTL